MLFYRAIQNSQIRLGARMRDVVGAMRLLPDTLGTQQRSCIAQARLWRVLVCPYASSLGLEARQNTPAIDAAFYYLIGTSYQLQLSFHTSSTEPEPTARARRVVAGPSISRIKKIIFFAPQ